MALPAQAYIRNPKKYVGKLTKEPTSVKLDGQLSFTLEEESSFVDCLIQMSNYRFLSSKQIIYNIIISNLKVKLINSRIEFTREDSGSSVFTLRFASKIKN